MGNYTITVRIFQTNCDKGYHRIVEKTVWNYANCGYWDEIKDIHVLTMGGSGTSGTMRFKNEKTGEEVTVTLGVHNYKRWCDIVSGFDGKETATTIQAQYYQGSDPTSVARHQAREAQRSSYQGPSAVSGIKWECKYTQPEGENLEACIIIG